jgi:hypothetical protein
MFLDLAYRKCSSCQPHRAFGPTQFVTEAIVPLTVFPLYPLLCFVGGRLITASFDFDFCLCPSLQASKGTMLSGAFHILPYGGLERKNGKYVKAAIGAR